MHVFNSVRLTYINLHVHGGYIFFVYVYTRKGVVYFYWIKLVPSLHKRLVVMLSVINWCLLYHLRNVS